ncbi:MAG TPA: response regulator transcription factor [Acidobacteriaceae bacterium]
MATPNVTTRPIRIGLLDFEPIRVTGLREILASRPDCDVLAIEMGEALQHPDFDLLLLLARRKLESWALLSRLKMKNPAMKAIVMAPVGDDETIMNAITAGAKGWLEETASPDDLLQAIDVVLGGSIWAPRKVLSQIVDRALGGGLSTLRTKFPRFTGRESDVLHQLVLARSNREIAHALSIREQTVKTYVARLMRKVGVDNRTALSLQAAESGWWDIRES